MYRDVLFHELAPPAAATRADFSSHLRVPPSVHPPAPSGPSDASSDTTTESADTPRGAHVPALPVHSAGAEPPAVEQFASVEPPAVEQFVGVEQPAVEPSAGVEPPAVEPPSLQVSSRLPTPPLAPLLGGTAPDAAAPSSHIPSPPLHRSNLGRAPPRFGFDEYQGDGSAPYARFAAGLPSAKTVRFDTLDTGPRHSCPGFLGFGAPPLSPFP